MSVRYELLARCQHTGARRGRLHTPHGAVETPCFMPVGTQGTVKGLGSEDLEAMGFGLVLSNTYHLSLRPGVDTVASLGGLHGFMGWKGAILTDSGGYQAFSLADTVTLNDQGVQFRSHWDGTPLSMTPESCIEAQGKLGVDIAMALDDCPPYPCPRERLVEAVERTTAWAPRNLSARLPDQAVFGIVQGGVDSALRERSVVEVTQHPFDGFAIGGVSVGEPTELQYPVVAHTAPLLPTDRPRYLMGVGHPSDILHAVAAGVDMFDCVLPTRMARHNSIYTLNGRVNALNAKWADDAGPWDEDSIAPALERYSAAYLRHLLRTKELLGARLASIHNLWFYARLMDEIRQAIEEGAWPQLAERYQNA